MRRVVFRAGWLRIPLSMAVGMAFLCGDACAATDRRPNIVLILGDDLAWTDYGFMGHDVVQTPALDRLARSGTTFRVGHLSSSLCGPTHFDLLTGVHHSNRPDVPTHPTLPREMERAGYRTFHEGKLWSYDGADWGFSDAPRRECDAHLGWQSCGSQGWGRVEWDASRCGSFATAESSCPVTGQWGAFLDSVESTPFFAMFSPVLPHHPSNAPPVYEQLYADSGENRFNREFFAMVSWFDDLVREIVEELDRRGLLENTLIVYLADNGIRADVPGTAQTYRPNFFKGKGSTAELGMRTPILFSWPAGGVPAGVFRDDLVSVTDVYATLLDVAGRPIPTPSSGISLEPAITSTAPHPRGEVVTSFFGARIVRTPEWRYVRESATSAPRLHAIARDPAELQDLAAGADPALLRSLEDSFEEWSRRNLGKHGNRRMRKRAAPAAQVPASG